MADIPIVLAESGLVPQTPASLYAQLLAAAQALAPGITQQLPGSLIEDITSTDVAATVLCDSALVELVNSLTPYGANDFLLAQLGNIYGVPQGGATNTSVQAVFEGTPVGYVIPPGFTVSDGTYSYAVPPNGGGVIQSSGQSAPIYVVATQSGSWTVPAGTVTEISTSVAAPAAITCSNPYPGVPGLLAQSAASYRAEVLQAGRAAGQGTPSYLKTLLRNVTGVQGRLIATQQQAGGGFKILVGGGDPYAVAYAIYQAVGDVSNLVGSVMTVVGVTNATNGVVTTLLNHGYTNGQVVTMTGVLGMTGINNVPLTVTVIDEKTFSTGVNTNLFGPYASGGVLTPNFRNNLVALSDYPDVYQIAYVSPPQQAVAITVLWNTSAVNYVNAGAIAQLAAPALAAYVNSVYAGQPMNLYTLEDTFRTAVASVLPSALLTRMVFEVSINGVGVAPAAGTGVIAGDPESYFQTDSVGGSITVLQG